MDNDVMTIPEFCKRNKMSRSQYYKLKERLEHPKELKTGDKKGILITESSNEEWRVTRRKKSLDTAKMDPGSLNAPCQDRKPRVDLLTCALFPLITEHVPSRAETVTAIHLVEGPPPQPFASGAFWSKVRKAGLPAPA